MKSKLLDLIIESVLDFKRKDLPKAIWDESGGDYILNDALRQHILSSVEGILSSDKYEKIAIVGSIASHYYNDKTDVDVHIVPAEGLSEEERDGIQDRLDEISFRDFQGTTHPVNFYMHSTEDRDFHADAIYDVQNGEWLKREKLEHANIRDYYDHFRELINEVDLGKAELRRGLIDYEFLRDALPKADPAVVSEIEGEINETLDRINAEIDEILNTYEIAKDERTEALRREFEDGIESDLGGTLQKFQTASLLPENVLYKLLERYGYKEFFRTLKEFHKENDEVDSPGDVEELQDIVQEDGFWQSLENHPGGMGGKTRSDRRKNKSFIRDFDSREKFAKNMKLKLHQLTGDDDERNDR